MTNKELISRIRLEIKRMISAHKTKNGFPKGSFCAVRIEAYNEVLDLLDTFKEPVSEDLEKEIDAYYKEWDGDCRYAQTALHFAQWGAEHPADAGKMISEDLDELIKSELPDMTVDEDLGLCVCDQFGKHSMIVKDIEEIARHFYEIGEQKKAITD